MGSTEESETERGRRLFLRLLIMYSAAVDGLDRRAPWEGELQ